MSIVRPVPAIVLFFVVSSALSTGLLVLALSLAGSC
jgi:hypothetical protein